MENDVLNISFSSQIFLVKKVVNDVLLFIDKNAPYLPYSFRCDLRLIFQELLINSVIHGNKEDASKKVHLHVEFIDDTIKAIITDEGSGFDYKNTLLELDDDSKLTRDHGRGLCLVRFLADSLSFGELGNEIYIYKKVTNFE